MQTVFYKGVLESELKQNFIPGSVTKSFKEAFLWKERIASNKSKGAAKHIKHGESVVIKFELDTSNFKDSCEFQRSNVAEHSRSNCWMNSVKTKAQINTVIDYYYVMSDEEINSQSFY